MHERTSGAAEQFRSDIGKLEAQLAAALDERGKLQREIAAMKHEAETTWAGERVENALLRERINDVAAEVARLTAALEGPDSPIEAMLAAEVPAVGEASTATPAGNGRRGEDQAIAPESAPRSKGTLAERIRALQSSASRLASN
jgi:chorismate mutase